MSVGIYKIENLINHKIYIGQSIHIEKRWKEHCRQHSNLLIDKAIKKYGQDNFSFEILEQVENLEFLTPLETKYIKQFNSLTPNGYNIVLKDEREHHIFKNYNQDIFNMIINDIKESGLSFQEISKKYNLDVSMIYYLNRGDYHKLQDEKYPLRTVKNMSKQHHYCCDCGIELKTNANRCALCAHFFQRKTKRPAREELKKLIRSFPFVKIAESFGVTDNAVRKWCKDVNLPYRKSEIKVYSDEEWINI